MLDQTSPQTVSNGAPYFSAGIKSPKIYPNADSTTAVQICKANGSTSVLTVDTTNSKVGINCTPTNRLTLDGGGASQYFEMKNGYSNNWFLVGNDSIGGTVFYSKTSAGADSPFYFYTGSNKRLTINASGAVIIDNLTASYIVHTGSMKELVSVAINTGYNKAFGTTAGTVSQGNHTHSGVYEPVIAAGTTAQYWRGDKSWQTLNTTAVTEGTNLYHTTVRVQAVGDARYLMLDQTSPQTVSNGAPYFSGGIKSPKVYPNADSTTAFQICKANGSTSILNVDTTNSRLGINCTPSVELEIVGAGSNIQGSNYFNIFSGSGTTGQGLILGYNTETGKGGMIGGAGDFGQVNNLVFVGYNGSSWIETVRIKGDGKVIIEDLTASYIVHTGSSKELVSVAKNTGYNLALVSNAYVPVSNGSAYINSYISQATNVINIATDTGYGIRIMRDDEDIYDEIHAHSTGLLLKTDYDANTSSPCWLKMQSEDTSPDYAYAEFRVDDCCLNVESDKQGNAYFFDFTMNGLPCVKFTADDDGIESVAIGAITGTEHLDVEGQVRIRTVNTSELETQDLWIDENGVLCLDSSDIRLKKDVTTINNALDTVLNMRGVNFKLKYANSDKLHVGMIAQEVEKICPELTFTNKSDGIKGIKYDRTVALLVEAIKEQQEMIDTLKTELNKRNVI